MPAGAIGYAKELILWLDQGLNALTGGYADETFSARCHRRQHDSLPMQFARDCVNLLFFWQVDHCRTAYQNEYRRKQLPPEYRRETP